MSVVGEVVDYEDLYRLCFVCGLETVIVMLAEETGWSSDRCLRLLHRLNPLRPPGRRLPRLAEVDPLAYNLVAANSMMPTPLMDFAASSWMTYSLTHRSSRPMVRSMSNASRAR